MVVGSSVFLHVALGSDFHVLQIDKLCRIWSLGCRVAGFSAFYIFGLRFGLVRSSALHKVRVGLGVAHLPLSTERVLGLWDLPVSTNQGLGFRV